jgi:hypothetical protein
MNNKQQPQPNSSIKEREARKADALRENLRKRKLQMELRGSKAKEFPLPSREGSGEGE